QLLELCQKAKVKPAFVQNRCFAIQGWDETVRLICQAEGIVYEGFSLLTANREVWASAEVAKIARSLNVTPAQVLLRFSQQIGILPLTGTADPEHMAQDLAIGEFELPPTA